ncbi:MAG TPA: RHS repeat-associated core domain-containing protein, partial [Candidatus Binataceae bacterium]|nr:RHS repeat-associated core domain-containing protein [Candidatus Binataceae bacterium]
MQEQYTEVTSDCATYSYPYTVEENLLTMPGSGEVLALTDSNGANMVPLHDALGSTLWMVNASGQMQTTFAYSSFGMPSQSGTAYYYPWLFAGMEWSDIGNVSQQYYAGARYYSPGLRRFISPDPMGFAGSGSNLFAYAGNDPVNKTDSTGLYLGDNGELTYGGGG